MSQADPTTEGALAALAKLKADAGIASAGDTARALADLRASKAKPTPKPAPPSQPVNKWAGGGCGLMADRADDRAQAERARRQRDAKPAAKPTPAPIARATVDAERRKAVEATRRATVERGGIYASAAPTATRAGRELIDASNAAINQAMILRTMADRLDAKGTDDATKDAARLNRQAAQHFEQAKRRATPAEVEESREWFDRFGHHLPGGAPIREASA